METLNAQIKQTKLGFTNGILTFHIVLDIQDGGYCPIVADYSKLITDNIELFKKFVKTTWREDKQYVLDDMTELQYEFIKDFHLMFAGYGTETDNRNYYELIAECTA